MIIASYSLSSGQCGCTVSTFLYSIGISIRKKAKVLLAYTQTFERPIEYYVFGSDFASEYAHLLPLTKNDDFDIEENVLSILNSRLELLDIGYICKNKNEEDILNLFSFLNSMYDYILIDAGVGSDFLSRIAINDADKLILNVNQNRFVLEKFAKIRGSIIKPYALNVSFFDNSLKLGIRHIQKTYRPKLLLSIPRYNSIQDACNIGILSKWVFENMQQENLRNPFFKHLSRMCDKLLEQK